MSIIKLSKPPYRWLFGGVGFHNSEATMLKIMPQKFRDEIAVKTFREISPTFSRTFAGYADWTREAMDAFADYYDLTYRNAGTLIYLAPGRIPYITEDFDVEAHCESVAANFDYLINERKCTKLRYYCVTNELSVGNTNAWFWHQDQMELYKQIHNCLYRAFRRHGLDIGLIAPDSGFGRITWATENVDETTECYCAHTYCSQYAPGDLEAYPHFLNLFGTAVKQSQEKEKRFILGEYGLMEKDSWQRLTPMRKDSCYAVDTPEHENTYAIAVCEMAMAAINTGCFSAVFWTMIDYPDPFIRENGDTEEEKIRYDVSRFSGHGVSFRYNKHGLIRWCEDEKDYSSRASLYTMGYIAKLFKKGSRVLKIQEMDDPYLRCAAVTNPDGTMSIAIINWEKTEKDLCLAIEHTADKPFRRYDYCAGNVPYNRSNDLQTWSAEVPFDDGNVKIRLLPESITFLTTDYRKRVPSEVENVSVCEGRLTWDKCTDPEHCYYRVFASPEAEFVPSSENQIASTVAEYTEIRNTDLFYKVLSIDRYGNTILNT